MEHPEPQELILPMDTHQPPNFSRANPLTKLAGLLDGFYFEAEREFYLPETFHTLMPIHRSSAYGFGQNEARSTDEPLEPRILNDFQVMDTFLLRGWVNCGGHCVPFLQVSYWAGPDSVLAQQARTAGFHLGAVILLWIRIGPFSTPELIPVPYDQRSQRFQVEIWGDPGPGFTALGETALHALRSGTLYLRSDLLPYGPVEKINASVNSQIPTDIELAWADEHRHVWDSCGGANHHFQFACSPSSPDTGGLATMEDPMGGFGKVERRVIFQPNPHVSPVGGLYLAAESLCMSPGSTIGMSRNPGCGGYYVVMAGKTRWATLTQGTQTQRTLQAGEAHAHQVIYHQPGEYLGLHNTSNEPVHLLRFRQVLDDLQPING